MKIFFQEICFTNMLFDRVDVAELLARDAFAKGAYMLGAEDREIMLK